jgi:hypothetical protein
MRSLTGWLIEKVGVRLATPKNKGRHKVYPYNNSTAKIKTKEGKQP